MYFLIFVLKFDMYIILHLKLLIFFNLDAEEYIHRVGRTARGAEGKGKALLILLKYEIGLIRYLRAAKVNQ